LTATGSISVNEPTLFSSTANGDGVEGIGKTRRIRPVFYPSMNKVFRLRAGSTLALSFCLLPLAAQEFVPPTSVVLPSTLTPVFKTGAVRDSVSTERAYSNFRMILNYSSEEPARLELVENESVVLPPGTRRAVEIAYEHSGSSAPHVRVWVDGKMLGEGRDLPGKKVSELPFIVDRDTSDEVLNLNRDFTAMVSFRPGKGGGTLISKSMPEGKWIRHAKALFLRNGQLVYDIGFVGALKGKSRVSDAEHVAVMVSEGGAVRLFLDGELEASRDGFTADDPAAAVFKIGSASNNFGGDFDGSISEVRFWKRALNTDEVGKLSKGDEKTVNTPDFDWAPAASDSGTVTEFGAVPGYAIQPTLIPSMGFTLHRAFVQPLALSDHAKLVGSWDDKSFKRGEVIYHQLCVTCHGTLEAAGSLPTAPRFHLGDMRNGDDPYRMFQTLEKGYGQMVPQPQYSTAQKYDVIHYVREQFLKDRNKKHFVPVDDEYLAMLPRGMTQEEEKAPESKVPQYLLQDFGNVLFWTLQVEPGNIAQKGIAIRVDDGPGGLSKGKAWMLYEHDTMRLAACWTGDKFVDWRGIAFDGSHGTHTSIVGEKHFVFPNEPMWANPETGDFEDVRIRGRDGLPYGPLPRTWVHFNGLEMHGEDAVVCYSVGDCRIREVPRLVSDGIFERRFYCGPSSKPLKIRLDEETLHVMPPSENDFQFSIRYEEGRVTVGELKGSSPVEPASKRFSGTVTTELKPGKAQGAWTVDNIETPAPDRNPWQSWMRTSGFDFFEGGKSAAVCTWNGDVWIVDGIDQEQGELKWQRICSGLFQPLGLKILDGEIYVSCRDMIAILRDLNGDRETDYVESFNSDHQVTEHFHEFAMGLQTDEEGNFYYAKSARHAKQAIVPHHGTLLKVAKDGGSTEILATGFRAANGVCLNPDGSFMVTDQEGNWNPKNRINWVKGGGKNDFYGNMWGYHSVTDESDEVMNQPLCWITNAFDRSPAELLWVPEDSAWIPLRGSLLNLSYGAGRIYTVPFEKVGDEVQGGMCAFPIDLFPTGVMRGRFSPEDGQLYSCGMFAWAGNQQEPGGFYRVRYTGGPAHQAVGISTHPGKLTIVFSDPLDRSSVEDLSAWVVKVWDLKRTSAYGSKHFNERVLEVSAAELSDDGLAAELTIPDLAPTWGMAVQMKLRGSKGEKVDRELHNSIFTLNF
jgi:hypothetical protein